MVLVDESNNKASSLHHLLSYQLCMTIKKYLIMVRKNLLILTLISHINKATCFNQSQSSSGHPVSCVCSRMSCYCCTLNSDSFLLDVAITSQYSLFIVTKPKVWHSAHMSAINRFLLWFPAVYLGKCYSNTATQAKAISEHFHQQCTIVIYMLHHSGNTRFCHVSYRISQKKCESLYAGWLPHQQCSFGHHTAYGYNVLTYMMCL